MIDLPPFVSKGSPIRAADQNKLINAVRGLAASNVAGMRGGNMQRSRFRGKKHPFEVEVVAGPAGSGEAIIRVHPGVWHGNGTPGEVTSGAVERYLDGQNNDFEDFDAWIIGEYNEETRKYDPSEFSVGHGIYYVVLTAYAVGGKINSVALHCESERPEPHQRLDSGTVKTLVAQVEVKIEGNAFKSAVVLQVLGGDFWAPSGGEGEPGSPFAWTKVEERKWQLEKALVMVTPNQLFGLKKEIQKKITFWRCSMPAEFTSVSDESGPTTGIAGAPHAPNSFWINDGIAVSVHEGYPAGEPPTLIYAKIEDGTLSWCSHTFYGSEWQFPWVSQELAASYDLDVELQSDNNGTVQYLVFRQDAFAEAGWSGDYVVIVPMAIIAPDSSGNPTFVPVRQGMIEVRPTVAIGMKPSRSTEFDGPMIYRCPCGGRWEACYVNKTCVSVKNRSGDGIETLDLLDLK